jgi:hypothetical protein
VEPAEAAGTQSSEQSSTTSTEQYAYLFLVHDVTETPFVESWMDATLLLRGDARTKYETVQALKGDTLLYAAREAVKLAIWTYDRAQKYPVLIGPLMIVTPTPTSARDVNEYLSTLPQEERKRFYAAAKVPISMLELV